MVFYAFLYLTIVFYSSNAHEFDPMQIKIRNITDEVIHTNSRYIEPFIRHTSANTEVTIRVELRNVIEFDVSKGTIRLYAVFYWWWDDKSLSWDENIYGYPPFFIRLSVAKIWVPLVYIQNSVEGAEALSVGQSVAVGPDGGVSYQTPQTFDVLCDPDVTRYPFDVHICAVRLAPLLDDPGFTLEPNKALDFDISKMFDNSIWSITKLNVTSRERKYVDLYIRLERSAYSLTLNLIVPVLLLGVMNLFAFSLPEESGERVSYSITITLSFIVYLTFTSEALPGSVSSICIFNVFLVVQLVESALISLAVIFISLLHHMSSDRKVPSFFRCSLRRCKKNRVNSDERTLNDGEEITWVIVASRVNRACFILFTLCSIIEKKIVFDMIVP